jgi:opacity protein-like surface antigen
VNLFADAAAFAKNPEENFQNAGITGGLDVDMPLVRPDQRLTFNLSNQFRSVTEVSSSAEQSDIGPRTQRTENFLNADLGYFLTRRDEFHVFYNRLDLRQENVAQFLDRNENTVGLTYFHQLRPLFSGLIEYNYQFTDFTNLGPTDPNFSSTGHILAIGFRREAAARLSGTIKVGAELRELERGSSVVEPFVSSLVTFRITPRQITNLTLTRSMEESSNQDFSFFNATTVNLRLTQELSAKISAFLEGRFELDEFEERVTPGDPATRQDRLYGVGGGVNYQFAHWLTTGLSYQYRTKNSNVQILDYVDHVAILRFTFAF